MLNLVASEESWHSTKPIDWEGSIIIVDFQDRPNCRNSLFVLIRAAEEMERRWDSWLPIRGCEINGNMKVDLPSRSQVVDE